MTRTPADGMNGGGERDSGGDEKKSSMTCWKTLTV